MAAAAAAAAVAAREADPDVAEIMQTLLKVRDKYGGKKEPTGGEGEGEEIGAGEGGGGKN